MSTTKNLLLLTLFWNFITVPSFFVQVPRNARIRYVGGSVLSDNKYDGEVTSSQRVSEYLSSDIVARNSTNFVYTKSRKPWTGSKYSPVKRLMRSESFVKTEVRPIMDISNEVKLDFHDSKSEARIIMRNASRLAGTGAGKEAFHLLSNAVAIGAFSKEFSTLLVEFNMIIKVLGDKGDLHYCEMIFGLMRRIGLRPSVVTYSTLISRAGAWKKVAIAERYFNEMIRDGIAADVQAYNSLINAYAKCGDTQRAVEVLDRMERQSIQPSIVTFNTLIDSVARSRNTSMLRSILHRLEQYEYGLKANARTYSSLIHACCQIGEIEIAFKYLLTMHKEGLAPTEITYSSLLHGCGAAGDIKRAFQLLELMKAKGIRPNVVTMSSIIHSCGKFGHLDLAFSLYHEMLNSSSLSAAESDQYSPNSITCSSLLDICLKAGQVERAFGVISDMRERGIPLTEVTYASLITELTRLGQLDRILEVFLGEPNEGIPPALPQKRYGNAVFPTSAKTISLRKVDDSSDDSGTTVAMEMMRLLGEAEKVDIATEYLLATRQVGFSPEYRDVLRASEYSAQQLRGAIDLIGQISRFAKSFPVPLNSDRNDSRQSITSVYEKASHLLVRGYVRAGNLLDAIHWLTADNLPVEDVVMSLKAGEYDRLCAILDNSAGFSELMYHWKDSFNHQAVVTVYEAMRTKGVNLGADAYKTLMNSIYDNAVQNALSSPADAPPAVVKSTSSSSSTVKQQMRHDELFRLYLVFQEMKIAGVQPDTAVYNTLINACAGSGDVDKALESLQSMRSEGLEPDIITYTSLIKACMMNLPTLLTSDTGEDHHTQSNQKNTEVEVVQYRSRKVEETVAIAEEIFNSMQQRTNHFSTYIAPNQLTYQRLIQTHWTAVSLLSNMSGEVNLIKDHVDRIWSLYDTMRLHRMSPGPQIYGCCIRAARWQRNLELGLSVLDHIRRDSSMVTTSLLPAAGEDGSIGFDLRSWQIVAGMASDMGRVDVQQELLNEINRTL